MIWIAPSERDQDTDILEKRLWAAADQLRANSGLTSQQYSQPVLGLIFLRFAEVRFTARRSELEKATFSSRRASRVDEPSAYHAEGVLYLSPNARFDYLLALPEGEAVGKAVSDAMRDIEKNNPSLSGVLPKTYEIFNSTLLKELLKKVSEIPASLGYDAFGRIYEYFLGEPLPNAVTRDHKKREPNLSEWLSEVLSWNLGPNPFGLEFRVGTVPTALSSIDVPDKIKYSHGGGLQLSYAILLTSVQLIGDASTKLNRSIPDDV